MLINIQAMCSMWIAERKRKFQEQLQGYNIELWIVFWVFRHARILSTTYEIYKAILSGCARLLHVAVYLYIDMHV